MLRPSIVAGRPAFGIALNGFVVNGSIFSIVSSTTFGPAEQFMPMTSTGKPSRLLVKVSVDVFELRGEVSQLFEHAVILHRACPS